MKQGNIFKTGKIERHWTDWTPWTNWTILNTWTLNMPLCC